MSSRTGLYALYPTQFTISDGNYLVLPSLEDQAISPNAMIAERRFGCVDLVGRALSSAEPRFRVTTPDLDSLLTANFSIRNGLHIQNDATFWFRERAHTDTFRSESVHPCYYCPGGGFLYLDRLSVDNTSHNPVTLGLEFIPFYDENGDPGLHSFEQRLVRKEYMQSLHGTSCAFNSWYWMGPVYWSGDHLMNNVVGWEYITNIDFRLRRNNGWMFAERGAIVSRKETLRIRLLKIDDSRTRLSAAAGDWVTDALASKMENIFLDKLNDLGGTAAVDFYLWKAINMGGRYGQAAYQHVLIRIPVATGSEDDISVVGEDDATLTLDITAMGAPALTSAVAVADPTGDADS